jgi:hypothetical protein
MSELKIDFEWLDPLAARGAELRATWARLYIAVDEIPLTRVFDQSSKTMRDAVYLPLYPFAEWLVEQWWSLWTEPRPSSVPGRAGYDSRHSFVHAREGYALPPVRIEPAGSVTLVSWFSEKLPSSGLEFPGQGEAWLQNGLLKDRFSSLVEAVVSRLKTSGITESRLQQEWAAIQAADPEEKAFCESAGALGLDPYDLEDDQREAIEKIGNALPGEIVGEFFSAARSDTSDLRLDAKEVETAIERTEKSRATLAPLKQLRSSIVTSADSSDATPWKQGYAFARKLRARLGLNGSPLKSMESLRSALGLSKTDLDTALGKFSSRTIPFAALMGVNRGESPAFVLRPARPAAARFHFCRALFEYLHAPGKRRALITDANTEQQKRNRAFAAEMLAPADTLRELIRAPVVTWERAEELANEFGVSTYVIVHQMDNHRLASVQRE